MPYSMDLRTRVLQDCDAGLKSDVVAAKYRVSRAWVNRLVQRRRESGQVAPRTQTKFRPQLLADKTEQLKALIAEQPDRTLVELRTALETPVGLATIWRAVDRLDLTVKKKRSGR
jgi:transposase